MTTTARPRKAAVKVPEESKTEPTTPDTGVSTAESAPAAPDVAPLEPPRVEEAPEAPAPSPYVAPTEVIPDDENLADVILDDATGEPPTDVNAVFVPLTPFGSTLTCTVRLVERTFLGPHRNPVTRLLQPKGAVVSEGIAARIRERLDTQAAGNGSNQ